MRGLSEPAERTASHCRTIECRGYARSDGLLDIEAQLIDVKEYDFPSATHGTVKAREPFHHMQVRVTVNSELQIIAAEAATLAGPYHICPKGADNISHLVGLTIGPGWRRAVAKAIGGPKGCTHITELMGPVATTAFQTLYGEKARANRLTAEQDRTTPEPVSTPLPSLVNSCIGYAEDEDVELTGLSTEPR